MNLQYLCHDCKSIASLTHIETDKKTPYHYRSNFNVNRNNPIFNPKEILKCQVSQTRYRIRCPLKSYTFDMSYIEPRIIAMGVPCKGMSTLWRNSISELEQYLKKYHNNNYKVYNLCSENQNALAYKNSNFNSNWQSIKIPDHSQPKFSQILNFCNDAVQFLSENPENIILVHCKAGKGRTGTLICSLLIYLSFLASKIDSKKYPMLTADEAIQYHGSRRTGKKRCVTIPSQKISLKYFEVFLAEQSETKNLRYCNDSKVSVSSITCKHLPKQYFDDIYFKIDKLNNDDKKFKSSKITKPQITASTSNKTFDLTKENVSFKGRSTINFYHKSHRQGDKPIFSITFDPFFHKLEDEKIQEELMDVPKTIAKEEFYYDGQPLKKPDCEKCLKKKTEEKTKKKKNGKEKIKVRAFSGEMEAETLKTLLPIAEICEISEKTSSNQDKELTSNSVIQLYSNDGGFSGPKIFAALKERKINIKLPTNFNESASEKGKSRKDQVAKNLEDFEKIVKDTSDNNDMVVSSFRFLKPSLDKFHKYFKVADEFGDEFEVQLECTYSGLE